ncbi:MAG: ABC-F family ATP-binding cassette domain-containing protein [Chloroflexi bacterium]|nr:ABC-F family ATP-binding cassette domain-containing protein [Chloroflexota bacterium]
MPLLNFSSLSKSFGPRDVFRDLSGAVPHSARIGIVGPNGIGKTTLLRMFAGLEDPSGGMIVRARGLRVGFLPQEAIPSPVGEISDGGGAGVGVTLWAEMLTAFSDLLATESELRRLEHEMADAAKFESATERYGHLQEQFERDGGYTYETRIKQTLAGLGFDADDYQRPVAQLSGGQKTRALLARLLLESPDLLILDEPTNHLDIRAVEWLEEFLSGWSGAALIVSHDRYFLDEAVNKIWDMTPARLDEYSGNYSAFVVQRAERRERQVREYEAQQESMAKEEDYIRRNIAGQNTAQAKGRRRRLERLKAADGALVERPRELDTLKLRLQTDLRSGDRVLETHGAVIGYHDDGKPLFAAPDLLLWRGEVAALIGPNGAGKTTFLKTLLGQLPPLKGRVRLGASLKIGYFAQAHEGLNPERTVIEEIQSAREMPLGAARDYAAKFLFTGDDVFKKVEVLSGGERGRVALAKLALEGANFLLLDEPTNHLDIPSQEILEAVLSDFDGTILLVSHDRYLIDALATQIWSLEEGRLEVFRGSYREFVEHRSQKPVDSSQKLEVRNQKAEGRDRKGDEGKRPPASNRPSPDERKRAQRIQELEAQIDSLEKRLAEIAADLEAAGADVARVRALGEEYAQVESDLNSRLSEWEQFLQASPLL